MAHHDLLESCMETYLPSYNWRPDDLRVSTSPLAWPIRSPLVELALERKRMAQVLDGKKGWNQVHRSLVTQTSPRESGPGRHSSTTLQHGVYMEPSSWQRVSAVSPRQAIPAYISSPKPVLMGRPRAPVNVRAPPPRTPAPLLPNMLPSPPPRSSSALEGSAPGPTISLGDVFKGVGKSVFDRTDPMLQRRNNMKLTSIERYRLREGGIASPSLPPGRAPPRADPKKDCRNERGINGIAGFDVPGMMPFALRDLNAVG